MITRQFSFRCCSLKFHLQQLLTAGKTLSHGLLLHLHFSTLSPRAPFRAQQTSALRRLKDAWFYSKVNAQSDEPIPSLHKPQKVTQNLKKQTVAEKRRLRHLLSKGKVVLCRFQQKIMHFAINLVEKIKKIQQLSLLNQYKRINISLL